MTEPLKIAVAGLGRMGQVHLRNVVEMSHKSGICEVVALVDKDEDRTARMARELQLSSAARFKSVADLASSGRCHATLVVTPTEHHREHAATLLRAGHRVLLEKPLTGTLAGDREFAAELDRDHPNGVMIAFQRRFDPALAYAKELAASGVIGRVFKIYSSLEDSGPPPEGYQSDGILPDMSIHNVDEILWLTGRMPIAALAVGSRVHNHKVSTCLEDFDDAMLHMWFEDDVIAQVQVSRNHVSGYRVESIIYGDKGLALPTRKKRERSSNAAGPTPRFPSRTKTPSERKLSSPLECARC
jgi:myo-inositol 2-dehydrogenase/D-chiro-inositol 1-dehydrogenase